MSERLIRYFTGVFVESKFSRRVLDMIFTLGQQDAGLRFLQILDVSNRIGAEDAGNAVQLFAAIMSYSCEWGKEWVLAVKRFYSGRDGAFNRSQSFDEACVIGLFAGANRYNQVVYCESEAVEYFLPEALGMIIFCQMTEEGVSKSFENILAGHLKKYFF